MFMLESKDRCLHALFNLPVLHTYMPTSAEAGAMTDTSGPLGQAGPPANAKAFFKRSYSVEVKRPKRSMCIISLAEWVPRQNQESCW